MIKFSSPLFLSGCPLCLAICDKGGLCNDCAKDLPYLTTYCQRCCLPLADNQPQLCGQCLSNPPPYDRACIPFLYADPINYLISQFKYHRQMRLGKILADCLATHILLRRDKLPDCLLPIPLHRTRMVERGFNQSLEITRVLSRKLGIQYDSHCLIRTKRTPPQTALQRAQRQRNVKGAFAMRHPPAANHVAIIDDVMTTTTTVCEVAKLLKHNKIETVEVWSLARAQ